VKVCLYLPNASVNDPIRRAILDVFRADNLSADSVATWPEQIRATELIIIDISAATALPSYALGLADAFGKTSLLLSPVAESIPPAFAARRAIIHGWNIDFLKSELQHFSVSGASASTKPTDDTPTGRFNQLFGDLLHKHGYRHNGPLEYDGSTFTLREQNMELALVQDIAHRAKSLNVRVRLL
jgi:hypothetical protein